MKPYCLAALFLAYSTTPISAADQSVQDYSQVITVAQSDLNSGRITEAVKQLETTEKTHRSFEYDYLLARTKADKVAPVELIQLIAKPKIESRYAVLNGATRQLVFICRDGSLVIHDMTTPKG